MASRGFPLCGLPLARWLLVACRGFMLHLQHRRAILDLELVKLAPTGRCNSQQHRHRLQRVLCRATNIYAFLDFVAILDLFVLLLFLGFFAILDFFCIFVISDVFTILDFFASLDFSQFCHF